MKIRINAFAYPESGRINGVDDPDEPTPDRPAMRPFLVASERCAGEWRWRPVIDVETGVIEDWPQGIVASIYDKPSDDCEVVVDGRNLNEGEYVPRFLSPGDPNHDDYLVMEIDGAGRISGWDAAEATKWIAERLKRGRCGQGG